MKIIRDFLTKHSEAVIGVNIVNRARFSNDNILCHGSCYLEDGNNSENNKSSLGTNALLQYEVIRNLS